MEGGKKSSRGPLSLDTDDATLNRGKRFDEAAEGISYSTFSPDSDSVVCFSSRIARSFADKIDTGFSMVYAGSSIVQLALRSPQFRLRQQKSSIGQRQRPSSTATDSPIDTSAPFCRPPLRYTASATDERITHLSRFRPLSSSLQISTSSFSESRRPDPITRKQDWDQPASTTRQRRIGRQVNPHRFVR